MLYLLPHSKEAQQNCWFLSFAAEFRPDLTPSTYICVNVQHIIPVLSIISPYDKARPSPHRILLCCLQFHIAYFSSCRLVSFGLLLHHFTDSEQLSYSEWRDCKKLAADALEVQHNFCMCIWGQSGS